MTARGTGDGLVLLACMTIQLAGQPAVPPAAVAQFNQTIGNRVEAVTILGGDHSAAGGIYTFRGGTLADVKLSKVGGEGAIAASKPLGLGEVRWAPVLLGNLGFISAVNEFAGGYLQGNEMEYEMFAAQLGGGVRFYFTEHLSLSPTVSGIYGRIENDFIARNPVGNAVKTAASGTFVDWKLDTWSVAPGIDGRYGWNWKRTRFELASRYTFFHTESFNGSSPVIDVEGNSHTWQNKLDVDVPLGWEVLGGELHTGGFVSRTELFGGASDGLNEDHVYSFNGRFVLDVLGKFWVVRWVGVGVSYFRGEHVDGWTAGLDLKLQF